ncbi:carotenoid oxygenase [Xylariomycetidae sp. FL0641]|nr:carotenoid oxygenase [Xylariomycetidae sp. FL0641]
MAASTDSHDPSKTAGDNDHEFEGVVRRMLAGDFEDWPNEAGFEGLTEVRGPVELRVQGTIPSWAAGTLYRTGPGQYDVTDTPKGTFRTTHWFDGFSHSHKFSILAGDSEDAPVRVEYSSRRQAEDYVAAIRETGKLPGLSFGQRQDPCIGLFAKVMSLFQPARGAAGKSPSSLNICVAVNENVPGLCSKDQQQQQQQNGTGHRSGGGGAQNLWVTTDAGVMKEVSPATLEPIGVARQATLHPDLKGPLSCAHAQRDPETGDLYNFNLDLGYYTTYRVFRTNAADGTTDILATICQNDVKPAYIHSFFLSPSYVILCVTSAHLGLGGVSVPWNGNIADAILPFDTSRECRWLVVDRRGTAGVVATFTSPAGFFFHSVNAFEEADESTGETSVYCDVVEYPSLDIIRSFEMDVLRRRDRNQFWADAARGRQTLSRLARHRLRIPAPASSSGEENKTTTTTTAAQTTTERCWTVRAPRVGELPTINPAYAARRHRYIYSLPARGHSGFLDGIAKTDTRTGQAVFWDNPRGHTPGEAVFVARPGGAAEDDGVLLSVVLDGFGKTSYLLCLDARDMRELGRAECGWAVGFGFHGIHSRAS